MQKKKTHHLNEAARTAQIFNGAAQFGHHAEVSHWTKTQRCTSSHHSAVQITIFSMLPLHYTTCIHYDIMYDEYPDTAKV